jgi:predicted nucleic acid-binding protein
MCTGAMRFVDTNVLLYAVSSAKADRRKADRAAALLDEADLALSVQVLQEFYVQATRAGAPAALPHESAVAFIATLLRFPIQETTVALVQAAFATRARWQLSFWDAAIVEAARAVGCDTVCTEDLQHGQDFGGVRIVNPFA